MQRKAQFSRKRRRDDASLFSDRASPELARELLCGDLIDEKLDTEFQPISHVSVIKSLIVCIDRQSRLNNHTHHTPDERSSRVYSYAFVSHLYVLHRATDKTQKEHDAPASDVGDLIIDCNHSAALLLFLVI